MKLRTWILVCFIGLLLLFAARGHAQSTDSCELNAGVWYKFRINGQSYNGGVATGYIYASKAEACSTNESGFCAWSPSSGSCDAGSTPWHPHPTYNNTSCQTEDNFTAGSIARQIQTNPAVQCPADVPEECDPELSNGATFTAGDWRDISASPVDFCSPVHGCVVEMKMAVDSAGEPVWTMTNTTRDCDEGAEAGPTEPDTFEGESCIAVGSAEYCATPAGSGGCGFLNDSYICLNTVPDMGCKDLGDDGAVCDSEADTPPAPDNGTPGVPATPNGELQTQRPNTTNNTSTTNNYNYFTGAQVAGSNRQNGPGTEGTGGGTDHGPVGGGGDDGDEESPCEGENCGEGMPELEEAPTVLYTTQAYFTRLQSAPIVEAALAIGTDIPTGECPTYSLNIFGTTIPFSAGCEFMPDIAPILEIAFFAGWCLLAFRILFSA